MAAGATLAEGTHMAASRIARMVALASAAATLVVAAAQASLAESPKTSFNAADQAAARAAVLKTGDLGAGWTGSVKKGSVEGPTDCPGWNPRQADLVITGAAESQVSTQGVAVFSSSWVYKSTRMIALDWQRTVVDMPMRCLAAQFAAAVGDELKIVSTKWVSFPKLATYSARFRIVAEYRGDAARRLFIDGILVGRGRTAVSIGLVAPYADRGDAQAAEIRLAKIVLSRIKT
jgi:hypothetical protein